MEHVERVTIDRLFEGVPVVPEEWDRLFAHLRKGCPTCEAHYAARRGEAGGAAGLPQLTARESAAIVRQLTSRLEERSSGALIRSLLQRWWGVLLPAAVVAGAALLLVHPLTPGGSDQARIRGGGDTPGGVRLLCQLVSGPDGGFGEAGPQGCRAGGPLVVETVRAASLAAETVSVALVDQDLKLIELRSEAANPEALVSMRDLRLPKRAGDAKVFVIWGAAPVPRAALEAALDRARASTRRLSSLDALDVGGVSRQRSFHLVVRLDGGNGSN